MDQLSYELKKLAFRRHDGSHRSRAERAAGYMLIARELRALGYVLAGARSLKPKHVEAMVTGWRGRGLSSGTIKNRMAWLRDWAEDVGKPNIIPRDNADLGIPDRRRHGGNLAHVTSDAALAALPYRMQLAMRLQMLFGLRLEESLKFRVAQADQGTVLALQGSWCKGGRFREVPVMTADQRALLAELRRECGTGSLIPDGMKYITYRRRVQFTAVRHGIRHVHGHRHWYAQQRYLALIGRPCPAAGGPGCEVLTPAQRAAELRARLQIGRELGHDRDDVTATYLGPRRTARAAR